MGMIELKAPLWDAVVPLLVLIKEPLVKEAPELVHPLRPLYPRPLCYMPVRHGNLQQREM